MVERGALIVGLDGFSYVAVGEILGKKASGTTLYALLVTLGRGNRVETFRAFDEVVGRDMSWVALCDAYGDEIEEVLQTVEAFDDDPDSVHSDITSSRYDDLCRIVREVRWELDARGHEDVGILVSGDLGPAEFRRLRDVAEGFGVGGRVSNANPVDFVLNIVEVNGEPAAKRGKLSDAKEVYRATDGGHHVGLCGRSGPTGGESLLELLIRDGEVVSEFDLDTDAAATWASGDAEPVGFSGISEE